MTTFNNLLTSGVLKRADAYKIRLEDLHEEPGFNLRDEAAVDTDGKTFDDKVNELVRYIARGGKLPPLEVRPRPEGGAWIVDGHRRSRAYRKALEQGLIVVDPKTQAFWVSVVPFEGNDAARTVRIMTSQEGVKLSPLEVSKGYARLIALGWSEDDIADAVGKTQQHVKQTLSLQAANEDVRALIKQGAVSPTVASEIVRKHGDGAGEVLRQELLSAQQQGKKKVTRGTVKKTETLAKPKVPQKLYVELHTYTLALFESMSKECGEFLRGLNAGTEENGPVEVDGIKLMQLGLVLVDIDKAQKGAPADAKPAANKPANRKRRPASK